MIVGPAADDDHILPFVAEHFSRHPRCRRVRIGAEITDAGVNVELAVRQDADEAVETVRTGGMEGAADADTDHLVAVALPGKLLLLFPVEQLTTLDERIFQIRAGQLALGVLALEAVVVRRIDAADLQPVHAELARGFVEQRLDRHRRLVFSGTALRTARWRVGEHGRATPAHRLRLVDDLRRFAGIAEVPETDVRAVVLDDENVQGGDTAVFGKPDLGPALEAGAARPVGVFLLARHAEHHGAAVGLLRQMAGERDQRISIALGAEAAAAILGDEDDVRRLDAEQARDLRQHERLALHRAVNVAFAVLP